FRRGGAGPVDQHDDRHAGEVLAAARVVALHVFRLATARGDHFAAIEEGVGDFDRLIEQTARIVTQIDNDAAQTSARIATHGADRILQHVAGALVKGGNTDDANIAVDARRYGAHVDDLALQRHVKGIGPFARDRDGDA